MNIDITAAPPSAAEVQNIQARHKRYLVLVLVGFWTFVALTGLLMAIHSNWRLEAVAVALCFGIAYLFLGLSFEHTDLPSALCRPMLELCNETPEGVAYRAAVIQQGRQFICAEYSAMRRWAQKAECKKLYGVAVLNDR